MQSFGLGSYAVFRTQPQTWRCNFPADKRMESTDQREQGFFAFLSPRHVLCIGLSVAHISGRNISLIADCSSARLRFVLSPPSTDSFLPSTSPSPLPLLVFGPPALKYV